MADRSGLGITRPAAGPDRQRCRMPPGPRIPVPPSLRGKAFTTAQGRSLGLGRSRMNGRDLDKPFYGIRVAPIVGQQPLTERCTALLAALPAGAFFSHLTAAMLWPLPLPMPSADEPVHVGVPRTSRAPRRSGVVGQQMTDPLARVVCRDGLPVVDPATLFCQLATELSLHDLVAVGDALILRPVYQQRDRRPWVPLPELRERVASLPGSGKTGRQHGSRPDPTRRGVSAGDVGQAGDQGRRAAGTRGEPRHQGSRRAVPGPG